MLQQLCGKIHILHHSGSEKCHKVFIYPLNDDLELKDMKQRHHDKNGSPIIPFSKHFQDKMSHVALVFQKINEQLF